MVLSFLYWALRRLLELLVLRMRSQRAKEIEILVLRHQLQLPAATGSSSGQAVLCGSRGRSSRGQESGRGATRVQTRTGVRRWAACQSPAKTTMVAPARMMTACAATAKAIASDVWTPVAIRMAAPAPAWVAAPAGAIGSAAEAAEAQRNASAIGRLVALVPTESACSSTNSAAPRR